MEKLVEKGKHDHKLTDLIKILIFTLILLLPGIVFLPTCLYYSINKYATNTSITEVTYKYESNEVTSLDDLHINNIYYYDIDSSSSNELFTFEDGYISFQLLETLYIENHETVNYEFGYPSYFSPSSYITLNYDGTMYFFTSLEDYNNGDSVISFRFYGSFEQGINIQLLDYDFLNYEFLSYTDFNVIDHVNENVDDTITHKIAKAYTDTWNEPLFNWTNNTPFNTGLNNFIAIFGITSESKIANTLIYILTITAIYVIFDIIIATFKWVTHIFTSK